MFTLGAAVSPASARSGMSDSDAPPRAGPTIDTAVPRVPSFQRPMSLTTPLTTAGVGRDDTIHHHCIFPPKRAAVATGRASPPPSCCTIAVDSGHVFMMFCCTCASRCGAVSGAGAPVAYSPIAVPRHAAPPLVAGGAGHASRGSGGGFDQQEEDDDEDSGSVDDVDTGSDDDSDSTSSGSDGEVDAVVVAGRGGPWRVWSARRPNLNWVLAVSEPFEDAEGHKMVATGSDDCTVRLWSVDTGVQLGVLEGHTDMVIALSRTPFNADDGPGTQQLLASGSADHDIRVWDINTRVCLYVLRGHDVQPVHGRRQRADARVGRARPPGALLDRGQPSRGVRRAARRHGVQRV